MNHPDDYLRRVVINRMLATVLLLYSINSYPVLQKNTWPDQPPMKFVFVENSINNTYFVTPGGAIDPRLTGSNHWTSNKYTGSGVIKQQSLGYMDNGRNTLLRGGRYFDMWLENIPFSHPLTGLRCINWYKGCDITSGMIPPQATDAAGFYGVVVPPGGSKWMHGLLSDSVYQYLQQMPIGGQLTLQVNTCETTIPYNAAAGERCTGQASGSWYQTRVTQIKAAHIRFIHSSALSEVFITSEGVPVPGTGQSDCKLQSVGGDDGLSCKMATYRLQTSGLSNSSIHIFPEVTQPALAAALKANDLRFSLNGRSWQAIRGTANYYTFDQMKSADAIYIFFSNRFFKKLVSLGLSDNDSRKLISFYLLNTRTPESGWYEFPVLTTLQIKPADLSVSITADDYSARPEKTGQAGAGQPALEFGYIITASGKTAADKVTVKVTGPQVTLAGNSYCLFSSADGTLQVPFPGWLSMTSRNGSPLRLAAGCDGKWYDITDALWQQRPWNDGYGNQGMINVTRLIFSLQMDDPRSLRTLNQQHWYGDVSASGEIHVKATWKNLP